MIEDAKMVERFMAKVDFRPAAEEVYPGIGGCWQWTSTIFQGSGYAGFWLGKLVSAHRLSYRLYNGSIPEEAVVRHRCDNRACVNPAHLDSGTMSENSQDMYDRDRRLGWRPKKAVDNEAKTHCKRGHAVTGENLIISSEGTRQCRECKNARQRSNSWKRSAIGQAGGSKPARRRSTPAPVSAAHQNADPGCE